MQKEKYNKLTTEELDLLAKAYLECRLSKLQEMELALALGESDASTPDIDEAREMLGIELELASASCEGALTEPCEIKARTGKPFAMFLRVAACIAAVIVLAVTVKWAVSTDKNDSYVSVYIDGKEISSEVEAQKIADRIEKECMEKLAESKRNSEKEYETCMNMFNVKRMP